MNAPTTPDLDPLTDIDLDGLIFLMSKLRGPGLIDPRLPMDPDNERYSPGIKHWANERLWELVDERDRRNRKPNFGGVATIVEDDD